MADDKIYTEQQMRQLLKAAFDSGYDKGYSAGSVAATTRMGETQRLERERDRHSKRPWKMPPVQA